MMQIETLSSDSLRLALWFLGGTAALLVAIVGFFIIRTLNGLDKTITEAKDTVNDSMREVLKRIDDAAIRIQGHETRLSRMEGFWQGFNEARLLSEKREKDGK